MKLRDFYLKVLPPEGNYVLATEDGRFQQAKAENMDALVNMTSRAIQGYKNVFFATGTYANGKRVAENTQGKKALYLDMDCGPGKEFETKKAAAVQLFAFCKAAKFPKPNLTVDSGNGVHAYWAFDKAIPVAEWQEMAEQLKELCQKYNFPADASVTADSARILRVPGSINKKKADDPKKCSVFGPVRQDYPAHALKKLLARHQAPKATVPQGLPDVDANDLSNAALGKRAWYAKFIVKECPTLKHIKDTGGSDCNEPLWMQTLNLLAYCDDGANYIHPVSNQHRGYDARMTERKFNARIDAKESDKSGPTLCKTFAMYPQAKCASCPHNGVIKSPITLGKEPPPPPEELPHPYKQDESGIYYLVEGERMNVCAYRIELFEVRRDPNTGEVMMYIEFAIGKSNKRYPFQGTREALTNMNVSLANKGIVLHEREYKALRAVMATWAQKLQAAKKVSTMSGRFGWQKNDFIAGGQLFKADGTKIEAPIADPVIQGHYTAHGDLNKWKDAANFVVGGSYIEMQAILASAFAAPLMRFTNVSGAIMSVISKQSGTGKSSAMKTAQAVWGHPIHGVNALNDTPNSVSHRMGLLNNLPLYWDELRQKKDVTDFLTFVFRAGQGRDKTRLTKSSEQMASGGWHTLITAASNEPLKDYVDANIQNTNAGMLRIFEMEINEDSQVKFSPQANRAFKNLESNYGLAGNIYAEHLVASRPEIEKQIHEWEAKIAKAIDADQNERFWVTTMAILMVGAMRAKKLGLVDFDLKRLYQCLLDTVTEMRQVATASVDLSRVSDPLDYVSEFIVAKADHVYVTEHFPDTHGDVGQFLQLPNREPVMVYISESENKLRIDKAQFRRWLKEQNVQPLSVTRQLKKAGAVEGRKLISPKHGSGQHTNARVMCYELDRP